MHPRLKETLDRFYREYDLKSRIYHDPIEFPHRYTKPEDIEIAGLIASSLAYGSVNLFKPVINRILQIPRPIHWMGAPPPLLKGGKGGLREFIINFDPLKDVRLFSGIKYRLNSEKDIVCLIYFIKSALIEYGSLANLFYSFYSSEDKNIANALTGFVRYFMSLDSSPVYGNNPLSPFVKGELTGKIPLIKGGLRGLSPFVKGDSICPMGLKQFFPSPEDGSACKRLNLYLRWMVRSGDGVDFGIWNRIPPSKLIIPLDTHVARICSHLGLTHHKTANWKMAEEITENLKIFDPEDPVKYDFALCHLGISGECPVERDRKKCRGCSLRDVCD